MREDRRQNLVRYAPLLLSGVVLLGAVLRFWDIGSKSLWLDEAGTRARLLPAFRIMVVDVLQHDSHPPFYYVVLYGWSRVWSAVLDGSVLTGLGASSLRAFSALCSIASLALLYLVGKTLFDRQSGLVGAGLMALSAFHVFFAQEARLFALSGLLGLVSSYLLLRCMRSDDALDWALYAMVNVVCFYTFYYMVFLLLAHGIALVLALKAKPSRDGSGLAKLGGARLVRHWLTAELGVVVLCLPLLPVLMERAQDVQQIPSEAARLAKLGLWDVARAMQQFATGFFTWKPAEKALPSQLLAAFVVISLVPLGWAMLALWWRKREALFCLTLLLVPFLCVWLLPLKMHVFESKQLLFASPFYFLLLGAAIAVPHRGRLIGAVSVVAVALCNLSSLSVYYERSFQKEDWREVASWVEREARPGDAIYANPVWLRLAFETYWQPRRDVAIYPLGEPRVWSDPELLGRIRDSHPRVWLIEEFSQVVGPDKPTTDWFRSHMREEEKVQWNYFFGQIRVTLLTGGARAENEFRKPA